MQTNSAADSPTRMAKARAIFLDAWGLLVPERSMKNSAAPKLATMAIRAMVTR